MSDPKASVSEDRSAARTGGPTPAGQGTSGSRGMGDGHYRRLAAEGDWQRFDSTDFTRSNWDPEIQHGSPPLALMTKLIEELSASTTGSAMRIGRVSMDILGAIPVAPVRVRAWVERPGSRISLLSAEMVAARPGGQDRAVARASAWLLATSDTADVATDRFPPVVEGESDPVPHSWEGAAGYLEAVSWRRQRELDNGSPVVWLRPLTHLVDDEDMTPTQRLALVVDCANGAGAALDPSAFDFMNTDTAMHIHRVPVGDDFALRSRGSIGPDGIGVTTAEIFDAHGFIGTCAQTLFVQRRP
jgi:Thioesterase-like superfamily